MIQIRCNSGGDGYGEARPGHRGPRVLLLRAGKRGKLRGARGGRRPRSLRPLIPPSQYPDSTTNALSLILSCPSLTPPTPNTPTPTHTYCSTPPQQPHTHPPTLVVQHPRSPPHTHTPTPFVPFNNQNSWWTTTSRGRWRCRSGRFWALDPTPRCPGSDGWRRVRGGMQNGTGWLGLGLGESEGWLACPPARTHTLPPPPLPPRVGVGEGYEQGRLTRTPPPFLRVWELGRAVATQWGADDARLTTPPPPPPAWNHPPPCNR